MVLRISKRKAGTDNAGNLVRYIDIILQKEYNYIYENNKIVYAGEYDVTVKTENRPLCSLEINIF